MQHDPATDTVEIVTPPVVSISLAAILSGLSRVTVHKGLRAGDFSRVWLGQGFQHPGMLMTEIEALRGRRITGAEYHLATRKLAEKRRQYRENHSHRGDGAAAPLPKELRHERPAA